MKQEDESLISNYKLTPELLESLGLWHNGEIEREMLMKRFIDDQFIAEVPDERRKTIESGVNKGMMVHRYPYWYYSSFWGADIIREPKSFGSGSFKGNFIPQIPIMGIKRFTHVGDVVIDPMAGSGTTLDVATLLNRSCVALDLYPSRADILPSGTEIIDKAKLFVLHPPYADLAIVYGDKPYPGTKEAKFPKGKGLSLPPDEFVVEFGEMLNNVVIPNLLPEGYVVLVIGDGWRNNEIYPLTGKLLALFYDDFRVVHLITKYIGAWTQRLNRAIWEYRALKSGFGVLEHEYVIVFQRR